MYSLTPPIVPDADVEEPRFWKMLAAAEWLFLYRGCGVIIGFLAGCVAPIHTRGASTQLFGRCKMAAYSIAERLDRTSWASREAIIQVALFFFSL
jgi:hypothetical protein